MGTLAQKFLKWLRDLSPGGQWQDYGSSKEIQRLTGLNQDQVSKLINEKAKGNVGLGTLEKIARHYLPGEPVWRLLKEIEEGHPSATDPQTADAETTIRRLWARWVHADPDRALRVLYNMIAQEELEITDLVSEIVHYVIDTEDPKEAGLLIANRLHQHIPRRTQRIRRALERYRLIYPKDPPGQPRKIQ